jgi:hypothetical protein
MAVRIRRVVTGHDVNGRAVVKIDEVFQHLSLWEESQAPHFCTASALPRARLPS